MKIRNGKICFLAALSDVMSSYGNCLKEEDLLVGTTGVNIISEMQNGKLELWCADLHDDIEMYTKKLPLFGWEIEEIFNLDSEEFKESMRLLTAKFPIIVRTDVFYMPYHPLYKKMHAFHVVLVQKCNKQNQLSIVDYMVVGTKRKQYKGRIDYDNNMFIANGKKGIKGGAIWKITKTSNVRPLELYYMENLKETAKNLLYGKDLNAVEKLKKYVRYNLYEMPFDDELSDELIRLNTSLTLGGGPGIARYLLGKYFRNSLYKNLANDYFELSRKWNIVGNLCIKCSLTKSKNILENIINRIEDINNHEIEAAEYILNMEKY